MEEFEEFMAEMLEEYNYDKDAIMVTTAFAQALASEWCKKQLLIHSVVKSFYCDWEDNGIVEKCEKQCELCLFEENKKQQ